MKLLIYKESHQNADGIHNFVHLYYALSMKYLASDLIDKGLSPKQISTAVITALKIANSSGIETRKHFMPIFSSVNQTIIQDCKLSYLGYGLVLLNADVNLSVVGKFQVEILSKYMDNGY